MFVWSVFIVLGIWGLSLCGLQLFEALINFIEVSYGAPVEVMIGNIVQTVNDVIENVFT